MKNISMKSGVFFFLFFLLSLNMKTYGFTLSNEGRVSFPSSDVGILIASNTCSTAGFNSPYELQDMVRKSISAYWNKIPTCALELEVEAVVSTDTSNMTLLETLQNTPVGKILVGCSSNTDTFDEAGVLGVGSINTASGDRGAFLINDADTSFANLDDQEKLATIAHELGHAFGLGHSGDPAALMYYAVGGKVQKSLSIDDYDACSYLYPHDSPVGCGSIALIDSDHDSFGGSSGELSPLRKEASVKDSLFLSLILGIMLSLLVGLRFRLN